MYLKNKYFGTSWIKLVSPLYITANKLQCINPDAFDNKDV